MPSFVTIDLYCGYGKSTLKLVRHHLQPRTAIRQGDGCRPNLTTKSLFQNILRVRGLLSIFCANNARSPISKSLRIKDLAGFDKKIMTEISPVQRPHRLRVL